MTTPGLHPQTLFVLDDHGRIVSTREPGGSPGPLFAIVPGAGGCAWGVHADVRDDIAGELDRIAQTEPLMRHLREAPVHAERYMSLLEHVRSELSVSASPRVPVPPRYSRIRERSPRRRQASGRIPLLGMVRRRDRGRLDVYSDNRPSSRSMTTVRGRLPRSRAGRDTEEPVLLHAASKILRQRSRTSSGSRA